MTTQPHDKQSEFQSPDDSGANDPGASTEKALTVVGIGASAGGLAALKQLLKALPDDTGVAFVVVVHLSPDRESHLADLLQPASTMPVMQVSETIRIDPNHVYVIPPNANLSTIDTHLRLTKLEEKRRERAPIDHFLRTLAQTHDGHSIGVVLTGTGSDGTSGLRWIKQQGGVTIAQLPEEAEFDGMPRSAISSGYVDLVLPIAEIPENIVRISRTNPHVPELGSTTTAEDELRDMRRILDQIRGLTGHDFSRYKPSTVRRRIARRMQLNQVETLPDYLSLLRQNKEEILRLFDDLLITVTEFFRDTEVFEHLEQSVIPKLFEGKGFDDQIRVWSVGCSTGEEAYSLAILLLEEAGRRGMDHPKIQVFASDLHERSLKCAREGVYPESLVATVPPERLKRWFLKDNGCFRVRPEVREIVVFAPHDLLKDPPFSRQDLVVCRNVMIYLQHGLQKEVLDLFNYALRPSGLLLLGSAESINDSEGFTTVDKAHCLFRKRNLPVSPAKFPLQAPPNTGRGHSVHREPLGRYAPAGYGALHAKMAEQYAPPSILVNHANDIVHYSAHAGEFLELRGGEPTKNVFQLVREPMRIVLRAAIKAAHDQGTGIRTKPITLNIRGEDRQITVRVRLASDPDLEGFALVIFDELHQPPQPPQPSQASKPDADDAKQAGSTNEELEAELHLTHHRLQGIIEEYETSQEQMQASNEELRSALEELETSREELQSMNEELSTLNQENQHRVAELSQLSADLNNLLAATQIATIFLDQDLRIVRFTPQVGELFNVRSSDRGRPLEDLTNRIGDRSLIDDARKVLASLSPVEREIRSDNGGWYLSRVLPYRASDDRIEGVVITLIEINQLKAARSALDSSEGRYRLLFDSIDQGFCVIEMIFDDNGKPIDYRFVEANPALTEQSGIENAVGRCMSEIAPKHEPFWYETYGRVATTGEPVRFQHRAEELGRDFDVYAFRVGEPEESLVAVLFHDITDRIKAKRELTLAKIELEDRVRERTAELEEKNKRLFELSRELASAEHRERKRLAAMLHDELQQYLVAVKTQLNVAADEEERDMYLSRIRLCLELVDQAIASSRDLTYRIRPPVLDEQGIEPGLKWLADATAQWYGLEVDIETHGPEPELTEDVQEALFDSVRELLFNVVKHAGVSKATISVETANDRVRVQVNDLGVGADTDESTEGPSAFTEQYGLSSVRERIAAVGGSVSITSKPGKGMHVCIEIPLNEDAAGLDTYDDHGE